MTLIELIWTITPALILILIAFPSFKLLYLMDEVSDPAMSVLAEGFFSPLGLFFQSNPLVIIGGLKLHILNKIKDTSLTVWSIILNQPTNNPGEKNNTLISWHAQAKDICFYTKPCSNSTCINDLGWAHPKPGRRLTLVWDQPKASFNQSFLIRTFHTKVRASSRIGPHNSDVISVLIGSLLGDSYAQTRTIEGTRFAYKQSIVHKDYLFWLYAFYYSRGYCSNLKPRMYKRRVLNKKTNLTANAQKEYYGYEFNTFTFRSFNWLHKLFYSKGKKVVKPGIEKYMTPLSLAIWLMDDGGWAKPGVIIATNSFKLEEVEYLSNLLKKLWDLNSTVQKINTPGQYSIYIKGDSVLKLRKLVLPYILPSMRYKLGL